MTSEGVEAKCQNATLSERNADMEATLVVACAVKKTMFEQLAGTERQITALKIQLEKAQFALEKLPDESSKLEADIRAQVAIFEKEINWKGVRQTS